MKVIMGCFEHQKYIQIWKVFERQNVIRKSSLSEWEFIDYKDASCCRRSNMQLQKQEGLRVGSVSLEVFFYSCTVTSYCCGFILVPRLIMQENKRISLTEGQCAQVTEEPNK